MSPFSKITPTWLQNESDRYDAVESQSDDDGKTIDEVSTLRENALRKDLQFYRRSFYATLVSVALLLLFLLFRLQSFPQPFVRYQSLEWSGLLGEDFNGFVPNGIGQPLKPTYFGPDHPYYMPEDLFGDFNKTIAFIDNLKAMHNGSSVLADKDHPNIKRIKPDGNVTELEPFWPWEDRGDGRKIYALRGFHQMHCIFVISEEFAYQYNNDSKWTSAHVAHCINTLRDNVMCTADAQPLGFANGYKNGHATDDQAMMCRDWTALRVWANDPVRGIRVKDASPPGSKNDLIVDIQPFPELNELELKGLA
ncbi:hypothetical protein J7T55_005349 [Diaporthe amygdali]|uniref:uncharacterized protein n=1 Tax=Phomopsis amygdali TaxID=1214568 RepID=UPI0022FE2FE9|nr:uncharacterized protein J7T55_005349 [Diaporthe amygdali]KAJ0108372.1 hypothetical protein J7T55_005349 [Diaporthe amygdali]